MKTYRVTMDNFVGYKDFTNKNKLRYWLMNYLNKENIKNLNIQVINR